AVAREILQVAAVPPVVIHPTSSRGLHDIEEAITAAAGTAHRLIVSEHRPLPDLDPALIERELDERGLDLLTFASPSAAETLLGICPEPLATRLRALPTLAVGETTAGTLRHLGFQAIHTPATPRVEDVVERAVGALG
ncbi:MAG: uroporphyrinogen-III synthase, partial [Planctomycetota bacterium]